MRNHNIEVASYIKYYVTNFNYFDSYYWHSLFDDFVFPDGSKPKWERVSFLQKLFIKWFNNERTKTLLTYPVESLCMLNDGKDYLDKEYKNFAATMWSKGHSFFVYTSDNADSVASCCFSSETKVLWKSSTLGVQYTTLRELEEMKWNSNKMNLKIFHNGFWIKGEPIKTTNTDFYKVTTSNHKTFFMTDNHINVTFDGEKKTSKLTTDDYLMFNTNSLNAIPEHDEHLTYEQGFAVGAFLGDGSFGTRFKDGTIYDINYSQNKVKYETCMKNITKANHQLGSENNAMLNVIYNNVYPVRISSKELAAFIQKWTNWTEGTHAWDKELNLNCLLQSEEFRKGILDGWYNTDGGNSNRCYTTSEKLKDCMEILITSLGMNSIIDCSDRTDEKVIIRGEEYNRNYPLWCIRWYEPCNKADMKDVYRWKNNSQFFKIISIEHMGEAPGEQYSYCIECNDQSNPYFTLPSGLITHNCRLRNDVKLFTSTTGLTGIEVGSCNVITLNLNRIIQDIHKKHDSLDTIGGDYVKEEFRKILERVYKYHVSYKNILYDWEKRGMITASNAGYIHMNKLYSTFGINGLNEAAEFCSLTVGNNPEYIRFCTEILGTIRDFINEHNSKKYMLNLEMVPAESLGVKNYNWDKEDGYYIKEGKNLYNSYVYNAHDPDTTILDKLTLQGGEIAKALSGGQACHLNLEEHLTKEQYLKLMDFAVKEGCNYFTFNVPNTSCDKCGKIYKQRIEKCPNCNSEELTYWTRIIGFLRPTKSFSKERQIEERSRIYHNNI